MAVTQLTGPAPGSRFAPVDLQAQYVDVIEMYVRRRVADPVQAERVLRDVFVAADADAVGFRARPLPWLIGSARRECARLRSMRWSQP